MKKNLEKTNVMRTLDQKKILYRSHYYGDTNAIAGQEVAAALQENPAQVLKTLIATGHSGNHYAFLVPVNQELHLKKAAKAAGEKNMQMIPLKQLLPLTGYIHGGCSPIGLKKPFPVFIHASAAQFETVFFSAGKIGYQVELSLTELKKILPFSLADLV